MCISGGEIWQRVNVDIMNVCVCVCLIMGDITVMRYQDVWTLIAPHLCLTSPVIEECVGVGVMSVRFVTTEFRLPVFPLVRSVM